MTRATRAVRVKGVASATHIQTEPCTTATPAQEQAPPLATMSPSSGSVRARCVRTHLGLAAKRKPLGPFGPTQHRCVRRLSNTSGSGRATSTMRRPLPPPRTRCVRFRTYTSGQKRSERPLGTQSTHHPPDVYEHFRSRLATRTLGGQLRRFGPDVFDANHAHRAQALCRARESSTSDAWENPSPYISGAAGAPSPPRPYTSSRSRTRGLDGTGSYGVPKAIASKCSVGQAGRGPDEPNGVERVRFRLGSLRPGHPTAVRRIMNRRTG